MVVPKQASDSPGGLDLTHRVSDSLGLGRNWEFAFLTSCRMMLRLPSWDQALRSTALRENKMVLRIRPLADLPACLLVSQWLIAVILSPSCPLQLPVKTLKHRVWVGWPNESTALAWGLGSFEKDPEVTVVEIQGWEPQACSKLCLYSVFTYDSLLTYIYWPPCIYHRKW